MKLESTKDYAKFIQNHEQRPIDPLHAKRIAENIRAIGYIPSKPIQCYKKGTKLVVVDGHHRLEAAKSIGAEVFYIVESDSCQAAMASENMLVKKWEYIDFVRLYASRGVRDYLILISYIEKGIPCGMASSLLHGEGASSHNAREKLASGRFKIVSTTKIDKILWIIQDMKEKAPAVGTRLFISAISKCLFCNDFDYDMFFERLKTNFQMMQKTSNEDQMMDVIEGIYNFRSRQPIPLKHLVSENSKSRCSKFGK